MPKTQLNQVGLPFDYQEVFADYSKRPKISVDYEVLERSESLIAMPYNEMCKVLKLNELMEVITMLKAVKKYIKSHKSLYTFIIGIKRYARLATRVDLIPQYIADYKMFKKMQGQQNGRFKISPSYPCLLDKHQAAGSRGSYLTQDLWAAQRINLNIDREEKHYDIGSRLDGFITMLLGFHQSVVMIDIRPLPFFVDELLEFVQADATNLDNVVDESISSLSALCSLEHFGLGRYGDPIDPDACFKSFAAIQRVMKKGGRAYISVPVGIETIEFNAHRIFDPNTIAQAFSGMKLVEFSVTSELPTENVIRNANLNEIAKKSNLGGNTFGLFEFEKI